MFSFTQDSFNNKLGYYMYFLLLSLILTYVLIYLIFFFSMEL